MTDTREALIERATHAFMSEGYYAASIGKMASAVGVVRQTVYNIFGSKAGLFRAVIKRLISENVPPDILDFIHEPDIRVGLAKVGRNYLHVMLNPVGLQVHRILASQVSKEPGLAQSMYELNQAILKNQVVKYIKKNMMAGVLKKGDAELAADQFLGMLLGHAHMRATYGLGSETPRKTQRRVAAAIDVLLRGYAP